MENVVKNDMSSWRNASTDYGLYVVQSNDLIMARQNLSKNAAKLIRATIMQIKPEDEHLDGIFFTIGDLAKLYGVTPQALYPIVDEITTEIMTKFVEFRVPDGSKSGNKSFRKVNWTSVCEYIENKGVFVKMNVELFPNLIGLKKFYTQYPYTDITKMGTVNSMRIYEMIMLKIDSKYFPKEGRSVVVSVEEIVDGCALEGKYKNTNDLKRFVIDKAVRDINKYTLYEVSYSQISSENGKKIVAFNFLVRLEAIKSLFIGKEIREQKYEKMFRKKTEEPEHGSKKRTADDNVIGLSYGGKYNEI